MGEQAGSIVTLSHIGVGKLDDLPDAASVHVAKSIRNRKSNCDASCGKDDGGCENCGSKSKDATPAATNGQAGSAAAKDSTSAKKPVVSASGKDSPGDPDSPDSNADSGKAYSHIVEVEFKSRRKLLYRNEKHLELALGDLVVVEAERGLDAGRVCAMGRIANEKMHIIYKGEEPLHQIVRKANKKDQEKFDQNKASEKEAFSVFRERIKHFELDMKGVDAEWQFDHHRLTLFFTAPRQVDFRSLVRDLAAIFTTRIELRQISPRDEAKRVGGMGICGRELCCSTFLNRFEYITLDHAREQQLAQNPTKLSGLCGRLKCCLLYEIDYYTSALKNYPPLNSTIVTEDGGGKMFKIDIFRDEVHLYYAKSGNYGTVSLSELNNLRRDGKVLAPGEVYVEPPEAPKKHDLDKLDAGARSRKGRGGKSGRKPKGEGDEKNERRVRNKRQDGAKPKDEPQVRAQSKAGKTDKPKEQAENAHAAGEQPNSEARSDRSRRRRRGGRGAGGRGQRSDQPENSQSTQKGDADRHPKTQSSDKSQAAGDAAKPAENVKAESAGGKTQENRGGRRDGRRGRNDRRGRNKNEHRNEHRANQGSEDRQSGKSASSGSNAPEATKPGGPKTGDSAPQKPTDQPGGKNKKTSNGPGKEPGKAPGETPSS